MGLLAEPVARGAARIQPAWTAYYDAMRGLGSRLMACSRGGLACRRGFSPDKTGHGPDALRAIRYPARDTAAPPGPVAGGRPYRLRHGDDPVARCGGRPAGARRRRRVGRGGHRSPGRSWSASAT